jgi:hypothetical protein
MGTESGPKRVSLGDVFSLGWGEEATFDDADLTLKLRDARCAYAGHRFEELGDEYRVTLKAELEGYGEAVRLSWHEREDPPGRVLTFYGYEFEVLGCRTGYYRKERGVTLRVTRSDSAVTEKVPALPPQVSQRNLSGWVSLGESFVLCRKDEVRIEGTDISVKFEEIERVWDQEVVRQKNARRWKVTLRITLGGKRRKLVIEALALDRSVPPQGVGLCERYEIRVLNCSTGYYNKERMVQLMVR